MEMEAAAHLSIEMQKKKRSFYDWKFAKKTSVAGGLAHRFRMTIQI